MEKSERLNRAVCHALVKFQEDREQWRRVRRRIEDILRKDEKVLVKVAKFLNIQ